MKKQRIKHRLLLSLILVIGLPNGYGASVSNLERERGWADQVVDFVVVGEPVWLKARGVTFLSLYTVPGEEHTGSTRGLILMHGRGVHPAWGIIETLRADLADAGWHTLSIQMPILATDASPADYGKTFPEAFQRIDAAIEYLRQRGVSLIALLGHSLGATMGLAYIWEHPQNSVAGAVAIGAGTAEVGIEHMQPAKMLEKITKPVLDIFGSNDLPIVLNYAEARREAAEKVASKQYTQIREQGADHFFTDRYDALKGHITKWLAETIAQ